MDTLQAILIAVIEGLTEYLPISSTAHMGFTASILGMNREDEFLKMFMVSIQFGAILSVVVEYWRKFYDFNNIKFYLKLASAVVPALFFGKLLDDEIEKILGSDIVISIVLIVGGIGFWQCMAMLPGTSRSAASIIGGMTQGLTRKAAAEFSFFLAVPTMLAVTIYSVFVKTWANGEKGYKMILSDNEHILSFLIGNIIAFIVGLIAVKSFIKLLNEYGFRPWGWYRIIVGIVLLIYFSSRA